MRPPTSRRAAARRYPTPPGGVHARAAPGPRPTTVDAAPAAKGQPWYVWLIGRIVVVILLFWLFGLLGDGASARLTRARGT